MRTRAFSLLVLLVDKSQNPFLESGTQGQKPGMDNPIGLRKPWFFKHLASGYWRAIEVGLTQSARSLGLPQG